MIPYFQFNVIHLGPVTIQVWGLCVALGILAATALSQKLAKKYFLSPEVILDFTIWCLIPAFIFARVFHVLFYNLDFFLVHPLDIFKVWQGGASSLGGFFGAALGVWVYLKVKKISWNEFLPYADIVTLGLWLGWGIGRIGCFLIHDHPGTLSHFILAVNYPASPAEALAKVGGARHDLGLYESILGFVLFTIFAFLFRRLIKIHAGLVAALSFLVYAIVRFFLDFLRIGDAQYAGLTPAQWGMMLVAILLIPSIFKLVSKK